MRRITLEWEPLYSSEPSVRGDALILRVAESSFHVATVLYEGDGWGCLRHWASSCGALPEKRYLHFDTKIEAKRACMKWGKQEKNYWVAFRRKVRHFRASQKRWEVANA